MNRYLKLGDFAMTTPEMRVSDPLYKKDVWCTAVAKNCLTGKWDAAKVLDQDDGWTNFMLCAKHSSVRGWTGLFNSIRLDDSYVYYGAGWSVLSDKIGVDSAACGFFDEANYKGGEDELDDWRDMCCSAKTSGGDVIPYGVVVQSGYGDGVYLCLQHTNKEGQVDAMAVIFG